MASIGSRIRRGLPAVALACLALFARPAAAQQGTLQLVEDSAVTRSLSLNVSNSSTRTVCEPGATWIRIGFQRLELAGSDAVTIESAGGDTLRLQGAQWNTRGPFHVRALRGECVELRSDFASNGSRYQTSDYNAGTLPLEQSVAVLAGAGDICDYTPIDCSRTADLIVAMNPTAVFAAGDNVYNSGTLAQYLERYEPNWGRFKALTFPVPGNHEYWTAGAAGYFDYFNGVGVDTGPAGTRGQGYYSYDVGDWHIVALNSRASGSFDTAQLAWLQADLAANTKPCTAAIFHHPLVSSGEYTGYAGVRGGWDRLYAAQADLVLSAHDHNYQRYAPMDGSQAARANGIVQVIVGTGGGNTYPLGTGGHPLLQQAQGHTMGVLRLELSPVGYRGRFVPVAGSTWTDSFEGTCHRAATTPPPAATGDFGLSASATMALDQGRSGGKLIYVNSLDGFSAPVTLSVSGLPSGVTGSFETNPVTPPANGSATSRLVLRASTTAMPGTYTVTVTGTDGTRSRTTSFQLFVRGTVPSGGFTLSASTTMAVELGRSGGKLIYVNSSGGFSAPVTLAVSGLPSGVSGRFETNPVTPPPDGSITSRLVISAATNAPVGSYTVTVTGTSGSLERSTAFQLTVR